MKAGFIALSVMVLLIAARATASVQAAPVSLDQPGPPARIETQAQRPTATPTGTISDTVAAIQATDPTLSDTFRRDKGRWGTQSDKDVSYFYAERTFHIRVHSTNLIARSNSDIKMSDFYLEVDTTQVAGPANSEFGVVFRLVDSKNYYLYAISGLGTYSLWKLVDNKWEEIIGWTKADALRTGPGAMNHLGLLAQGSRFGLLANDVMLVEVEDDAFAAGTIALAAGTFDEGEVEVAFDNLDLWDLAPVPTPTPTQTPLRPTATPTPEKISDTVTMIKATNPTFSDTFRRDDGTWNTQSDEDVSRFYERGAYHLNVQSSDMLAWGRGDIEASDFYLEVDTAHVAGPLDNELGVLFRYVDGDNFYFFAISSDGFYKLQKLVDGKWEQIIKWTQSDAINTGEESENRLGLLAVGSRIALLVNDEVLDEVEDDTLDTGTVALAAGTFDEGGVEIAFDNLKVWELKAKVTPTPTATPTRSRVTPTATPAPEELSDMLAAIRETEPIFTADFRRDDGTWGTGSDENAVRFFERGAYHIQVQAENRVAWTTTDVEVTDFYLEVETAHVAGPLDNEFGVLFRYEDDENFYMFSISSDGYYRLQKLVDDEWESIVKWKRSDAINTGEESVNRLGLLAVGTFIVLLVNDEVVDEIEDDTFAAGNIGLAAGAFEETGVEIAFDNLKVWELAP